MKRLSIARMWPMRKKHFHAASLMKYFVIGAILLSLVAMPWHVEPTKADSGTWTLAAIKVFPRMSSYSAITSESYNKYGGTVEINVSGNALNLCPGGSEKMRFTWQFGGDVSQVSNGGSVNARLDAGVLSYGPPCNGRTIAPLSYLTMHGSRGSKSLLPDEETRLVDGERLFTSNDNYWVVASDGRSTVNASVGVTTAPMNGTWPLAFFTLNISTRAGDQISYVYVYQMAGSGGGGGNSGGGGSFTVEDNTDRRGGDYLNFDLTEPRWELCRNACANDSRCRAFTYVRPGGQGPSARCWLKSSVPEPASGLSCCISGVRR